MIAAGFTCNELTRKAQWVRRTFRDEYLNDLIEAEEVTTMPTATSGGIRYLLTEYAL